MRNEPGLAMDVVRLKAAPDRKSIYYYVQELKRDGMITHLEGTRPLFLYPAEKGRQPMTQNAVEPEAHSRAKLIGFSQPELPFLREIKSGSAKLAKMHMEMAALFERLACTEKLHREQVFFGKQAA